MYVYKANGQEWRDGDANPATSVWARRMTVARGFARHMTGVDPDTEIPPLGLVRFRQRRRPPFIYSAADITALMSAARRTIPTPLRAATVETIIGLLATTGMRVGEATGFQRGDLDTAEGVITLRHSKFGKSRLVPLHASTLAALGSYAQMRDRVLPRPASTTFFVSTAGTRLFDADFGKAFRRLLQVTGVGAGAPHRPRVHDMRHSFAVHTLVRWYRAGEDVGSLLVAERIWWLRVVQDQGRVRRIVQERIQRAVVRAHRAHELVSLWVSPEVTPPR